MRPPDPHVAPRATRGDSLCPVKIGECIGEGRGTPPRRTPPVQPCRPAWLNPIPLTPIPPNPTLEGWYPRKYAYCTIYRK